MRHVWTRRVHVIATAAITTLVVIACAKGTDGLDVGEGGVSDEGSTSRDVNVIPTPNDGAPPEDTGTTPGNDSGSCTMKVVINELRSDGANANDEFVELYNPTTCAVPLGNWQIKYESSGGGAGLAGYKFAVGESIPKKGYFLVASSAFSGAKDATLTSGMAAASGQVGLLDDKMKVVDAVAYGTVTAGSYREKNAAPAPASGKSIGRVPDGTDSDSNSADFKALTASSPGAAN